MRPKDLPVAQRLSNGLDLFSENTRPLLGIEDDVKKNVLIEQMLESIHRIEYINVLKSRGVGSNRADPTNDLFDPEKGAIWEMQNGNTEEAFWLVFISVHFGRNKSGKWRYAKEVYGGLGSRRWTWENIHQNFGEFREWFLNNLSHLGRQGGGFGNHRKYQSLKNTIDTFQTYINWVGPHNSHIVKIQECIQMVGDDPKVLFAHMYASMRTVSQFGRTGIFDYLTMLGKLGLAPIEPNSTYMGGATGPVVGARLLFTNNANGSLSRDQLENLLNQLDEVLNVGMQVLEDSLCNWQKSPSTFVKFRG